LLVASSLAPFVEGAEPQLLATTLIPVLLTAFFFRPRWILVGIAVQAIAVFTQIVLISYIDKASYALLYQILLLANVLILVFITHIQGIERERRERLETANEALRQSELLLERRVDERTEELKVARDEAIAAREQAEEADRIKSQFLASMSHELRTPLNAILNFTEMTALGMVGPVNDQQVDVMNKSLDSGRHLLSLINDVLDITKIQSGMMKLFVEEDFDVISEMQTIASTAEKLLADKPVNLVVDVDHNFPPMACDKRRVRQVLLNLVANAVKFTEKGTITLSAKHMGDQALFAVIDTGPGIAREDIEIVFKPFVQTETGIRHQGGTGLGLPISERMVEAHGGKLWVDSVQGEGSSFFVRLPLKSALVMGESEMVRYVQ
jgi:signal transduction histidine kinase